MLIAPLWVQLAKLSTILTAPANVYNCSMTYIHQGISLFLVASFLLGTTSCTSSPDSAEAVRAVIQAQQAAWNRGDIVAFMDGYERTETTTLVSGDELMRGWQTVLERYKKRYGSPAEMGILTFSDLDVQPLDRSHLMADGPGKLTRANHIPHRRLTSFFRQTGTGWRSAHDTTTDAAP